MADPRWRLFDITITDTLGATCTWGLATNNEAEGKGLRTWAEATGQDSLDMAGGRDLTTSSPSEEWLNDDDADDGKRLV
ncbi:hypothetical protein ACROYT_G030841 [Oculina patagonica]